MFIGNLLCLANKNCMFSPCSVLECDSSFIWRISVLAWDLMWFNWSYLTYFCACLRRRFIDRVNFARRQFHEISSSWSEKLRAFRNAIHRTSHIRALAIVHTLRTPKLVRILFKKIFLTLHNIILYFVYFWLNINVIFIIIFICGRFEKRLLQKTVET